MKKLFIFLNLMGLILGVINASAGDISNLDFPVEVVEIRDLGLSDRDESRSLIEVRWRVDPVQKEKIASFNLVLSVTYADGTTIRESRYVTGDALFTRFEVPSVKSIGGRPSAFIKKMEARVTAVISKKLNN